MDTFHSPSYDAFRTLLKRYREDAGISQDELGRRLELTQSWVSKVERGERRVDVVEFLQIARAIGFDPTKFFKEFESELAAKRARAKTRRT